jgi:hypothetical protein
MHRIPVRCQPCPDLHWKCQPRRHCFPHARLIYKCPGSVTLIINIKNFLTFHTMARRWLGAVAGRLHMLICCGTRVEPTFASTTARGTVATAVTSAQRLITALVPESEFTPTPNVPSSSSSIQNSTKPYQSAVVNEEPSESIFPSDLPARVPRSKALLVSTFSVSVSQIAYEAKSKIGIHYTEHFNAEWPKLTTPGKDVRNIHAFLRKCKNFN